LRAREMLDQMATGKAGRAGHQDDVAHCRC
jgi:hypothetical protein